MISRHAALRRRISRVLLSWLIGIACTMLRTSGVELVPSDATAGDGFAVPQPGRLFRFPNDHGSHPEFRIEWWYVTGHLTSGDGTRHSFQATFFRRAGGRSPRSLAAVSTNFASDELFLAHMAWLDVAAGRFRHEERLNRKGWDAAADTEQLAVRNGNWSLRDVGSNTFELHGGVQAEVAWTLTLKPKKPLVIFGTNGVSRKAAEPWASSHYLTFPRLAVTGQMRRGSHAQTVQGEAWMDHELSSSQLGQGQVGWDWASVQLQDGRELMAYRMRREDGKTDPFSTVAWISREGRVTQFGADQFTWKTEGNWKSPHSGAQYPAAVVLSTPKSEGKPEEVLRIEPLSADQELSGLGGSIPYWEGACRVLDSQGRLVGNAFLEMTGYAGLLHKAL